MSIAAFLGIYLISLAAAISPGPAVLLAARTSLREGFVRGAWLAVGIGLGACVWAVAAMFGLALLFKIAPGVLTALKFFGAAYFLYLAVKMWRHAPEPMAMDLPEDASRHGPLGQVWRGVAAQLANPKPAVFFGTVFLTFLPPVMPFWAYGVVLAIIFFNDTVWNVLVARIFSLARTRALYLGLKTVIDRIFGGLLGLLGLKLALT